jgi:hypothetical protein
VVRAQQSNIGRWQALHYTMDFFALLRLRTPTCRSCGWRNSSESSDVHGEASSPPSLLDAGKNSYLFAFEDQVRVYTRVVISMTAYSCGGMHTHIHR